MRLLLCAGLLASWLGCSKEPRDAVRKETRPTAAPKIVQFYATPGIVARGEPVSFCYGVENARAVRIQPSIQALQPAWNRCFQFAPARTATYILTATGADGSTATRAIGVRVDPAAPKPRTPRLQPRPRMIRLFAASATETTSGQPVTLCYGVENATSVKIEPHLRALEPVEKTCFMAAPAQTTTYTLTAKGPPGTESASLVITVR